MLIFLEPTNNDDFWTALSAIGTILAAVSSWIAIGYAIYTNKQQSSRTHAQFKPYFMVRSCFEKRPEKTAELTVINKGYKDVKGPVKVYWKGDECITVKSDGYLDDSKSDNGEKEFVVFLNYKETKEPNTYKGKIIIVYDDILGKTYKESIEVELEYIFYDIYEVYNPVLKNVIKPFE